jgi:hypothetical protein
MNCDTIVIEGTLTKVVSKRAQKAELTIGSIEVCWQVRDPEKMGLLSMLQNGIIRCTIENPQMEMFRRQAAAENEQYGLDLENEEETGQEEDGLRFLPEHQGEESVPQGEEDSLGEEVSAEELGEEFN